LPPNIGNIAVSENLKKREAPGPRTRALSRASQDVVSKLCHNMPMRPECASSSVDEWPPGNNPAGLTEQSI
jgi:hypothetical protein